VLFSRLYAFFNYLILKGKVMKALLVKGFSCVWLKGLLLLRFIEMYNKTFCMQV
jgi:hypothetical protein